MSTLRHTFNATTTQCSGSRAPSVDKCMQQREEPMKLRSSVFWYQASRLRTRLGQQQLLPLLANTPILPPQLLPQQLASL